MHIPFSVIKAELEARAAAGEPVPLSYISDRQCPICHTYERLTAWNNCRMCNQRKKMNPELQAIRKAACESRKVAIANKQLTYEGAPCKNCGGTERYVKSSGCKLCINHLAKQKRENHCTEYVVSSVQKNQARSRRKYYKLCPLLKDHPGITLRFTTKAIIYPGGNLSIGKDVFVNPALLMLLWEDYQADKDPSLAYLGYITKESIIAALEDRR